MNMLFLVFVMNLQQIHAQRDFARIMKILVSIVFISCTVILSADASIDETKRWLLKPAVKGAAILLGLKARISLLIGTKRIRRTGVLTDSGILREYVKKGSYADAIRDFKSVHPSNIQTFQLPDTVMQVGKVGNMKILVKGYSETGYPTLTIINPNYLREIDQDMQASGFSSVNLFKRLLLRNCEVDCFHITHVASTGGHGLEGTGGPLQTSTGQNTTEQWSTAEERLSNTPK